MGLNIKELNKTLTKENRLRIVSREKFLELNKNSTTKNDMLVCQFKEVEKLEDGYKVTLKSGQSLAVKYSGEFSKNGAPFKMNFMISGSTYRPRVNWILNTSIYPERLIGLAKCWYDNRLPESFSGLEVNVKDSSGSKYSADFLGIPMNFEEENLEWTLDSRNKYMGRKFKDLFAIMGKAYRVSANDEALVEALTLKNNAWIKHYVMRNYKAVGGQV